jgi:hypothetical protein
MNYMKKLQNAYMYPYSIVMVFCVYVPACLIAAWQDWYVDNTWTGINRGTKAEPFTNIQHAVDYVASTSGVFSADTIYIKDTGVPYTGPVVFPNINAMRLKGYNGRPTITYTGESGAHTIQSGDNYFNPNFACFPPSQVGLEQLRIENLTEANGNWFCADIQTWVSWEAGLTNEFGQPDYERYRYGIHDCEFSGSGRNGGIQLRDLDQRHRPDLDAVHTSLVWNCTISDCRIGINIMSSQKARVYQNYFISNQVALSAVQTTNSIYQRPYSNVVACFNVIAFSSESAVQSGVYPTLLLYNNTIYATAGTSLFLNAGAQAPQGPAGLNNTVFCNNTAAWLADHNDTNLLSAEYNLYYSNAVTTGWDVFDTHPIYGDPLFVSTDPADALFLYPLAGSAADQAGWEGIPFIGALPPVPEPGILSALGIAGVILRRYVMKYH